MYPECFGGLAKTKAFAEAFRLRTIGAFVPEDLLASLAKWEKAVADDKVPSGIRVHDSGVLGVVFEHDYWAYKWTDASDQMSPVQRSKCFNVFTYGYEVCFC
jgi:hypothetical protein